MNRYEKQFYEYVQSTKEYTCLSKYEKSSKKVIMRHDICSYEWEISPNSFKSKGTRCPNCYGNVKYSNDDFLKEFYNIEELLEYKPLEEYKNNRTPIVVEHLTCGNSYKVTPYKILKQNNRCPYCSGRKGHDYKKECSDILGEDFRLNSTPKKHVDMVHVTHLTCGNNYFAQCNKILQGRKCPYCKSSKMEEKVRDFLKSKNIKFKEQYRIRDCRNRLPLPFDFAAEINNELILIECQGRQHYEKVDIFGGEKGFSELKKRDSIKREYCTKKNIRLIEIHYKEDCEKYLSTKINI